MLHSLFIYLYPYLIFPTYSFFTIYLHLCLSWYCTFLNFPHYFFRTVFQHKWGVMVITSTPRTFPRGDAPLSTLSKWNTKHECPIHLVHQWTATWSAADKNNNKNSGIIATLLTRSSSNKYRDKKVVTRVWNFGALTSCKIRRTSESECISELNSV